MTEVGRWGGRAQLSLLIFPYPRSLGHVTATPASAPVAIGQAYAASTAAATDKVTARVGGRVGQAKHLCDLNQVGLRGNGVRWRRDNEDLCVPLEVMVMSMENPLTLRQIPSLDVGRKG